MTFPPPHPSAQSSIASGTDKSSSNRPEIGAWGRSASQSGIRRGLTPLATNLSSAPSASSRGLDAGPGVSTPSSFSAVLSSSRGLSGGSPKPAHSPFTALAGSQQQAQSLSSPKFRAHTPSAGSYFASTTSSITGGGGSRGGGGPGSSRGIAFSPLSSGTTVNSPTGFASDKPGSAAAHSSQSSLTKISIAQVFLLLDSITEKEGKEKWETKAAQIHKLVTSNGMEVFSKYFRRLLTGNAPQIFPGVNKSVENAGNYPLLVQEIQKVSSDVEQAQKIAETVDTSEGDIFRDFDLSTFLDHFRLDPIVKVALALAFKMTNRSDLRAKADAIISNSLMPFLQSLAKPSEVNKDFPSSFIGVTIERFILYPPPVDMPFEVSSALQLFTFVDPRYPLLRQLHLKGPRATASIEAITELINASGPECWGEDHLASALLFVTLSQQWQRFSPENLLAAYTTEKQVNWSQFFSFFDREGLIIEPKQFERIYNALLAYVKASDGVPLDVQKLWGGDWEHRETQISFLTAFIASRTDVSQIPNLRASFPHTFFDDAPEPVKVQGERAAKSPLRSMDAIKAIFDLALFSQSSWTFPDSQLLIKTLVQHDLPVFLVSALAVPQPWTSVQQNFVLRTFVVFISQQEEGYQVALHGAWHQDRQWVSEQLFAAFTQDPTATPVIYEHAANFGWLDYLLGFTNGLALDLACYSHRKKSFDLEQWVRAASQKGTMDMGSLLSKFLRIKAEDEVHVQRKEQSAPQMVSLSVKTVYTLLSVLEEFVGDRENLTPVQRICIQTYPRLINYGEGFDDIIDANGANDNKLPDHIDKQMQDLFGKMYHEELSLREMLELMRQYKTSREPQDQDLFACMVHGLIDEYHCYHEYPLEALTKTAVMFGGIINFRLVDGITLKVGLGMILEAVREHEVHDPMFKFGVEAIEQLINRLSEWAGFCHLLLQIPNLQGTPIFQKAEEVLREQGNQVLDGEAASYDINSAALTNGNLDDSNGADGASRKFRSIQVGPPLRSELYQDPDEEIQDKILFVLNNVSEQNIDEKLSDLREVLRDQHHQWFAAYLVEERAKLQPNFQKLYLDLLDRIGDKILWAEVLRETYVSVAKLLNSEGTLNSSTDRGHLKNLGAWLGSLTIAKDKPVKHKNIYFKGLLLEGYDSQRLMVTIPFTCKVLVQATKSTVFKPPNPWLMDILGLLLELYHFAELKLNLKFEIEVLCKDLALDHKTIEPSVVIRERTAQDEEALPPSNIPEGLEAFEDMALNPIGQGIRNERLSPAAIMSTLPSLDKILVLPASASSMVDPGVLRQIVNHAVERAIGEIITPVVERSVTIASISTVQLISKDFAMEPDEEKVRHAAGIMARQLAGSLALVTCKEPLKVSMTNYIRMTQQEHPEQPMPEGLVLMCVNDNLDAACGIVEKAAEDKSVPEIEKMIEPQLEARRRHLATRPDEPFIDPSMNRWGLFIPEPYRQAPGGLNKEQLAIYEEFARQSRGSGAAHPQNISTDSGRQLPDILQESYPAIPNLSTPAEQPAVPHRTPQAQHAVSQIGVPTNGFLDAQSPAEKVDAFIAELKLSARNASVERLKDLDRDTETWQGFHQVLRLILHSANGEELARLTTMKVCSILYHESSTPLQLDVLVQLLARLCDMSTLIARYAWALLAEVDDDLLFNAPVTAALIEAGLLDLRRVDGVLSRLIQQKNVGAVELLDNIMSRVLLNDEPAVLRSDFIASLEAICQWLSEDGDVAPALELIRKLQDKGRAQAKRDQMEYVFNEWVNIYKSSCVTDQAYYAFLQALHDRQVMNNAEDSTLFFRLTIDISVTMFEHESQAPGGSPEDAFLHIDGLAKLIILLVKFQGESSGAVKGNKASYFGSILSTLVLPRYVPGFVYGWLALVSHRVFMSDMLNMPERAGWAPYCEIMQALLSFIGEQLKATSVSYVARDLYKGVLRVLLVLHHDFPEFVAENHFQFCNVIPAHCAQLRNLVLSAYPSSFAKLPDPFREGLKANIKRIVDAVLQGGEVSENVAQQLYDAVSSPETRDTALFYVPIEVDIVLINALVLYIGQQAALEHASKSDPRSAFENSTHSALLEKIAQIMQPEARYYLLSAMANQLRYPNSHTYFFSFTILRLFGVDLSDQDESDIRQQIIRVLLERLIVHRPHPWGLIITLQELLQNRSYSFFHLPFIQAAPEIGRLFDALLQHIQQQSPRPLA
ncbi:CCR4-Not complex component N.t1.c1 C-terminal [Penicillium chermesinum]|uniref:General negative regulator of transcription subunit 1 n=1 Tax=Penicillium chermesinum TaxID=63820 RepID=A0A9W9TUB7_9EURO|nr:CCR4-Not complex component N.t1.c1 C-terminal [Penicillium chermesinum]KAJ5239814.1 CCR4-Not complex component N.t1.c1 C-terminal [Penicillium chermesinum]